jgi:glycerol-3-phosphate dehydrogenase
VNAAGPWVDDLLDGIERRRLIGGTKGSHLIVEPFPGAPADGVYVEAGADARPFFILPWNGVYLIGTTDERFGGDPGEAVIDDREFAYLVAETERVFPSAAPLGPRVLYTQSGVRPLPHERRAEAGAITRRHLLRRHPRAKGLCSIVGGKLTTHRALAEDVRVALRARFRILEGLSPTRDRRLPGALDERERAELVGEIAARLSRARAERLADLYGAFAKDIAALARDRELSAAIDSSGTLVAELVHAVDREWASTLGDILQRRTMAGASADFGLRAAPTAAEWLARVGVWDRVRAAHEIDRYSLWARRFRVRALDRAASG